MIQKTSKSGIIGFLNFGDEPESSKPTLKKATVDADEQMNSQRPKHMSDLSPETMTEKTIRPSRTLLDNNFESKTYPKTKNTNTIWEPNKLDKLREGVDDRTRIKQEKASEQQRRKEAQDARFNELAENLKKVDLRKASSISGIEGQPSTKMRPSKTGFSIFDSGDFDRLPEKTAGEKVTEETKTRRAQVDESWRQNGKSRTTKDITNELFDRLINSGEENK